MSKLIKPKRKSEPKPKRKPKPMSETISVPVFESGSESTSETMTEPGIAVIIPTYNRCHMLRRALNSVQQQTFKAAEICVVDDGSDDDTVAMLAEEFPGVMLVQQANRGVSAARNAGVQATRSDWLAFLDSDDEWFPDKLEQQIIAWQHNQDYRLVHCNEIWIRRGHRVKQKRKHSKAGGDIFKQCLPQCAVSPSAVLLQRSLLAEVGGFDELLPACEDYDLWLRICAHYPVLFIEEPLLRKHGGHDDQLSRKHWGMDRFQVHALDKLLDNHALSEEQVMASKKTLIEKCQILQQGAMKHDNEEVKQLVAALMHKHELHYYASNG